MRGARALLPEPVLGLEGRARLGPDETGSNAHGARGIQDVDDRSAVGGRDLDGRVDAARRRAPDQKRCLETLALHLARDVHHLVERGRDQTAQSDQIGLLLARAPQDAVARHHHAQVDDPVVVALEDHPHDVLADVVHVPLDRGHHDRRLRARAARSSLLRLHERKEAGDRLLHHARALDDLGEKHLARAEEVADRVHAGHQRTFDHLERALVLPPRLLDVGFDELQHPLDQGVREPLLDRALAPALFLGRGLPFVLDRFREADQAIGRVGPPVQEHVFDQLEQVLGDLLVDGELARVDDPHVRPGPDRVVQEGRMHRLAHGLVAAERERDVAHAAADLRQRKPGLDDAGRLDEVDRIASVLFDAGGHGQDVRVEDDVLRREPDLAREDAVGARRDLDLALDGLGLALLVEGHHDDGRAVALHSARLPPEDLFALLEAEGVDHPFPLHALQSRLDDRKPGAVDHDRDAGDVGLRGDQAEEGHHRLLGVEHRLVHVDVDQLGPAFDLLARDRQRFLVVPFQDQAREFRRTGDVGPLADVDEVRVGADRERFQSREPGVRLGAGRRARRRVAHRTSEHADVLGGGAAAAADQVQPAPGREIAEQSRHLFGGLVVFAEGIGEAGVGVAAHPDRSEAGELLDVRAHLGGAQRAVDPDGKRVRVRDRVPEGLDGLARERAAAAVGDRDRNNDRNAPAALLETIFNGRERRLGVQGVEDRLHQQEVDPAFQEAAHLISVSGRESIEVDGAKRRVLHLGGDRGGPVGRPDGACDKTRPAGFERLGSLDRAPRQGRRRRVQLAREPLKPVVGQ